MIKYNIVVCCYDKIFVNVGAYVIPGLVCVCVCLHTPNTTCKLPEDGVLTPKHFGVILIHIHTTYMYIRAYMINIHLPVMYR